MLKVLHSSAGAGKTHALVKEYLRLALNGPGPAAYAHVLALTFTNKAAAEMRERVLCYLEALCSDQDLQGAEADVQRALLKDAGIGPDELRRRALDVRTHMLHHWPKVAISTIDAFMRRVVAPFARELRLDQDLRMTIEEPWYRAKAVGLLLEEAGKDPDLTKLLISAGEQLLEEERPWQPDEPLLQLAEQLGKENALRHLAELRHMQPAEFLRIQDRLRERTARFRQHMRRLGADALAAIRSAGLAPQDLAHGDRGFLSYLGKLAAFKDGLAPNAHALKAWNSGKWHSASAGPAAREALERIAPLLESTIGQVEERRKRELPEHILAVAVLRDLMATAVLHALDQCLEQLKREDGTAFFSDLTRKVHALVQEEPAPFLYERLGEQYKHFLVDEFQDTSLMQWHALLPLVENALAADGTVLLVGDAKQAIYRWRNGEARQFSWLPDVFGKEQLARGEAVEAALHRAYLPIVPLVMNRRSACGIIRFNNELTAALKAELDEPYQRHFERHEQEPASTSEGLVQVDCYERPAKRRAPDEAEEEEGPQDDGPQVAAPWRLMTDAVEACLEDGFQPGDIAVLVRTGAQGAKAGQQLAAKGWAVVSPDGLKLGADPGACAVMAVMAWLQQPDDPRAAMAAQAIATLTSEAGPVDPFPHGTRPQDVLRHWRDDHPLIGPRLPLITLICRLAQALGRDPATDAFLMALVDDAQTWAASAGDDLAGFLEHWERTGRERAVGGTPGADAVQVMTVHKAKGLEFPVVIFPEAGKSMSARGERIWIATDTALPAPPTSLVARSKALMDLGVPELVEEKKLDELDELDVLYVAITRAVQRLYINVPAGNSGKWAAALCGHLGLEAGGRWTTGRREPPQRNQEPHAVPGRGQLTLTAGTAGGERPLAIRREAPEDWDPADPDPYRSRGRAVHAILAHVRTPADLPRAMELERTTWALGQEEAGSMENRLRQVLEQPAMQPFFGPGLHVLTEATLLTANGRALRPDRIVRDGAAFRILDIKTGAPLPDHHQQVREYMDLLHQVEQAPVEGGLLYLRTGELVTVAS
jgi:ATP-dependent helicase/nuclease subunit A